MYSNIFWHFSSHTKLTSFFNKWVKSLHLCLSWEMNILTKFIFPWRILSWLRFLVVGMLTMAFTLLGSFSISLFETIKLSNFPKVTPKSHFWVLNLSLYLSRIWNTYSSKYKWSWPFFNFTMMLSIPLLIYECVYGILTP